MSTLTTTASLGEDPGIDCTCGDVRSWDGGTCEDGWRVRPKARKEERKKAGLDSEYIEPWKASERDRLDGLGCAQGGT
jgi:hypothetical protein